MTETLIRDLTQVNPSQISSSAILPIGEASVSGNGILLADLYQLINDQSPSSIDTTQNQQDIASLIDRISMVSLSFDSIADVIADVELVADQEVYVNGVGRYILSSTATAGDNDIILDNGLVGVFQGEGSLDDIPQLQQELLEIIGDLANYSDEEITYTSGGFLSFSDGSVVNNANFEYSMVAIPADSDFLRISGTIDSLQQSLAVFYDGSGSYISFEIRGEGVSVSHDEVLIRIPEGAETVGISKRTSVVDHVLGFPDQAFNIGNIVAEIQESQSGYDLAVDSLSGWSAQDLSFISGFIRNTTGAVTANVNFHHTIINIPDDVSGVRVTATVSSAATALAIFYDADGNYISSELDGNNSAVEYVQQELTIPEGTASIGFSNRVSEGQHVVEFFGVVSNIAERVELLESGGSLDSITVLGDSTSTVGINGIGDELAALQANRTTYQQGIGGQQWNQQIAHRIGARIATISVTGGLILSDNSAVSCTLSNQLLNHPTTATESVMQIMVEGVRCELRKDSLGSNDYTVRAMDSIAADVVVPNDSEIRVLTGFINGAGADANDCVPLSQLLSGIIVIRTLPSINDRFMFDDRAVMQDLVDDVMGTLTQYTNKIVLLSVMNGQLDLTTADGGENANETLSYQTLSGVRDLNNYVRSRWPNFVDALQLHIDDGGSITHTINGVDFEVLTTSAPTPKIRSDGRHEEQDAIDDVAQAVSDYINNNF